MDKIVNAKKITFKQKVILAIIALLVGVSWYGVSASSKKQIDVNANHIEVVEVTLTPIQETMTTRGTFVPNKTIYIDAVEGGRVDKVFVEDGTYVKKGQPLLQLSNTSLQLDVISREAQISEQLNSLQNTQLAIEQNSLKLEQDMANFNYKIMQLKRVVKQNKRLLAKQLVSQENAKKVEEEFAYLKIARGLTIRSQNLDNKIRETQLSQLKNSVKQLQSNLIFARKNLDNLIVKAPMNGQLSALSAELGQSKGRGERLGQIDQTDQFKVEAYVDEFYLNNLYLGQITTTTYMGSNYQLSINKIFSQVENGKFKVEFAFSQQQPSSMRRGQNLTLSIIFSDEEDVLTVGNRGFIEDSGGHWIYVLATDGKSATKRKITLGRRSSNNFEVLKGLHKGDWVIASSYQGFQNYDIVNIEQL